MVSPVRRLNLAHKNPCWTVQLEPPWLSFHVSSSNVFFTLLTKSGLGNAYMGTSLFAEFFLEKNGDLIMRFPHEEVCRV